MQPHFVLVTYPAQGHINPCLQFAKRLIRIGVHVTFITTISACRRMDKVPAAEGLSFLPFSDGYDDGNRPDGGIDHYLSELRRRGKEALSEFIVSSGKEGKPITCIVYSLLVPWVAEVARKHHIPSAVLWIQSATVFSIYYFYFNGYEATIKGEADDSNSKCSIKLPNLPPFASRDIPSLLSPTNILHSLQSLFQEHIQVLAEEPDSKILVNTFDALEPKALKAIEKLKVIGIGPLIASSFLNDPLDTCLKADLFECNSNDYLQWLNSKSKSTVVYVSFGSISSLRKEQVEEIGRALLASGRPFLWVLRNKKGRGQEETEEDKLSRSCREELGELGMIVPWCSQVEVLSHPSLGCFVSHCGWNSTFESLVSGVPVVAFPQWSDQGTNAKLIEDIWKTGVRVSANEDGVVERGEIMRCLDLAMGDGEKGKEVRENVEKWKELAREAAMEGGSLDMNLKAFVNDVAQG